jgi:hypothetical protein
MKPIKDIQLLLLFIVSIFIINCNSYEPNEIIGTWTALNNAHDLSYTFTEDTVYIKSNTFEFSCRYRQIKSGEDSLFMYFPNDDIPLKHTYKLSAGKLLLVSYKDIGNIDEVILFTKTEEINKTVNINNEEIEFTIEIGFVGTAYVNFQGIIQNSQKQTINVPKTGLIEAEFKENPFSIYSGNLSFVENSNAKNKIPFFHYSAVEKQSAEKLFKTYNKDSIYVGLYGFNQIGRNEVNKIFGREVKGNVFMFRVDTLKNLLKKPQEFHL